MVFECLGTNLLGLGEMKFICFGCDRKGSGRLLRLEGFNRYTRR